MYQRPPNYHAIRVRQYRQALIELLGSACSWCGNDDWRVLEIDHIDGGGTKERRKRRYQEMVEIVNGTITSDHVQLLCANCHTIKTHHMLFDKRLNPKDTA